jgi:hypothetical protein
LTEDSAREIMYVVVDKPPPTSECPSLGHLTTLEIDMLTITNTTLHLALTAARPYAKRGAIITSVVSPHAGQWIIRLTWEREA